MNTYRVYIHFDETVKARDSFSAVCKAMLDVCKWYVQAAKANGDKKKKKKHTNRLITWSLAGLIANTSNTKEV